MALDMTKQVKAVRTPWGEAWSHNELVIRMNAILEACGIAGSPQRVKMTAHAIFASGWRQNCFNYNAWGVKVGSWKGPWFSKGTQEATESGEYYSITAAWRAFSGWCEAVQDYTDRIGPDSWNQNYREASKFLPIPGEGADRDFWAALGAGGYYTDKQFGPQSFASLCSRVRSELGVASDTDLEAARNWAVDATGRTGGWPAGKFPFPVIAAVVAVALAAVVLYFAVTIRSL